MAEGKEAWGWMGRLNTLVTLLGTLAAAVVAVIGYFSGVSHGESKQRTETQESIDRLSGAVPESQKSRTTPVFEALKTATMNAGTGTQSPAEISKLAQTISNAVTGLPTGAFSVGTSRIFTVPEQKTALVCGDKYHVSYGGHMGYSGELSLITFDEERWETKPGNTKRFSRGVSITLMQVEEKLATVDVICQLAETDKPK